MGHSHTSTIGAGQSDPTGPYQCSYAAAARASAAEHFYSYLSCLLSVCKEGEKDTGL